jgi:hypothetical protein
MPDTLFKAIWNVLIILLLAYTAIIAPFRIAFFDETGDFWSKFYSWFDVFVDIVFGLDIIVNFISPYEKPNMKFEYNLKKIAINYLTGFFIIDFVATLPIGLIIDPKNAFKKTRHSNQLLRITRLQKLYRLTRMVRLVKLVNFTKYDQ